MNEALNAMRPRMMAVAYRILGSVVDAEDAVQDAFLRLLVTDSVTSPEGFLVKTTTHRCIDRLRAKRHLEKHVRPGVSNPETCGSRRTEPLSEPLSEAFLFMLQRLTLSEMAAYLLRTAFNYGYSEIAEVLGKEKNHARQIFCRANSRLIHSQPRFDRKSDQADRLAERFIGACQSGDVASVEKLFVEDAEAGSGCGTNSSAAKRHDPFKSAQRLSRINGTLKSL